MTAPLTLADGVRDPWPQDRAPPAARLLIQGGDARIDLDPAGTNGYGCPPLPDPGLLGLGSATASVVSGDAFAAVERLYRRLDDGAGTAPGAAAYARELARMRRELLDLCAVADLPGVEIVFGASGTDLHLIAAQLVAGTAPGPAFAVMMDAAETGKGVAAALAGRHFSSRTALGRPAARGARLAGAVPVEVVNVPLRLADGTPRQQADIDAQVECLVTNAVNRRRHVLLVLIDVSKTGAVAPSPEYVAALHRRLPESVDVLVDACQFRIAPATLRSYLEHEFMVALTGSKFIGGPSFSGALLVPASLARRFASAPSSRALEAYCAAADLPARWPAARALDAVANYGLLLRWEAALHELRAFRAVPEGRVTGFLRAFAATVQERLAGDPSLEPLTVLPPHRRPLTGRDGWDDVATVFPFLLRRRTIRGGAVLLTSEETLRVHRLLQQDLSHCIAGEAAASRFHLGQPVACGIRDGAPRSALRLCAGARLVVEAASGNGCNASAVIGRAMAALDKAVLLI